MQMNGVVFKGIFVARLLDGGGKAGRIHSEKLLLNE